jgi:Peptidase inhibitor family I36
MSLRRHGRRAIALALLMGTAGCETASLPSAPSDLSSGVSIYEHANFLGDSALLGTSSTNLSEFKGPCEHTSTDGNGTTTYTYDWNDCVSSVRVAPGWRAILYRDTNYRGQALEVAADAPNLQLVAGTCSHDGLNDCVTSIKVIAPGHAF